MKLEKSLELTDVLQLSLCILVLSITWYFMHGADHFLEFTPRELGKYFNYRCILIAHITAGGGALVLGSVQFWERLRRNNRKLHRVIGILYLLAILTSSFCAVILAGTTAYEVNWAYAFSLQVWVSVWIIATFMAYRAALKKKFKLHKEWMTRSYLVTLAFVISGLALRLSIVERLGSFADISPSFFWMGWSVPLFIYELFLSRGRKS
jgi:uncharacterized membrane protein